MDNIYTIMVLDVDTYDYDEYKHNIIVYALSKEEAKVIAQTMINVPTEHLYGEPIEIFNGYTYKEDLDGT